MAVTEAMPIPDLGPLDSMNSAQEIRNAKYSPFGTKSLPLVRNIVAGQLRKVGCEELAPNGPYG